MKTLMLVFSALLVLSVANAHPSRYSHRHPRPYPGHGHPGHDHDDGALLSLGVLFGLTSADITSHANDYPEYKMAIVQAEDAALAVLQGAPVSDLFLNAVEATQSIYNIEFGSEEEAAIVILKLNQHFAGEGN
jgi:hypothetical protein